MKKAITTVSDTRLLCLLLSGNKQKEIAQMTGLTESQVSRRIHENDFQELLKMYRSKVVEATSIVLASQAQKAAMVLTELLDNSNDYLKFSAANSILKLAREYNLQVDVMTDIEELKASVVEI